MTATEGKFGAHFNFMARCYESHSEAEQRGYRSAIFDAVHLLDTMSKEAGAGRPSKAKAVETAKLKAMADRLWRFYEERHPAARQALSSPEREGAR